MISDKAKKISSKTHTEKSLYTGKKGQEKLDKPVIKNQQRNKIKKDGIQ